MGSERTTRSPVPNGLLSKAEREVLRGERDVEHPEEYRGNVRYRARKRIEQIEEDLELLAETDNEDIVEEFHDKFSGYDDLEERVNQMQAELEELKDDS